MTTAQTPRPGTSVVRRQADDVDPGDEIGRVSMRLPDGGLVVVFPRSGAGVFAPHEVRNSSRPAPPPGEPTAEELSLGGGDPADTTVGPGA